MKFGGFLKTKIDKKHNVKESDNENMISDNNCFLFSFKNNRINKFELKEEYKDKNIFALFYKNDCRLFTFGNNEICIGKSNWNSRCLQNNNSFFDYKGIEDALNITNLNVRQGWVSIKKVFVAQMKKY